MSIHLYAICWNEGAMIRFFLRHYEPIVDRFVIFDDHSTDGTAEILRSHPKVELRTFRRRMRDSLVLSMLAVYDEAWKESRGRADWVIVTNIDEHLHHADLAGYLDSCRKAGVTAIPSLGYQMIADVFPPTSARLCAAVTRGAPSSPMSKLDLFNPDAVRQINYTPGRHRAWPEGDIRWPARDEVLNLHYKYLGLDYTSTRNAAMKSGLGKVDRRRGWGLHYLWNKTELEEDWQDVASRAVDIGDPALQPWSSHDAPRWWRTPPADRLRGFRWRLWRRWMALRPVLL